jgi:hypothetical protein
VAGELEPVRRRRFGPDRGWLVALGIVALLAIALLKPWSPPPIPPSSPLVAAADHATSSPAPESTLLEGTSVPSTPSPQAQQLTLAELRQRGAKLPKNVFSAVMATARDAASVRFVASAPATRRLGVDCAGGALLSEGSSNVGLVTNDVPLTDFSVERLFRRGPSVPIPTIVLEKAADGFIVAPAYGATWPVGDYSVTIRAHGALQIAPFCVGRLIRLVDYSLIAFMPAGVDSAAARSALLADLGPH